MGADTKPKPADLGTVHLPRELLNMAKIIATHGEQTIAEIVAEAARPGITRRYKQTVNALNQDVGGEGGGA